MLEYVCVTQCTFPNRMEKRGNELVSLARVYREGDSIVLDEADYPPLEVTRHFQCMDPHVEAQRQAHFGADLARRAEEAKAHKVRRASEAPHLQASKMIAGEMKDAIKELATTIIAAQQGQAPANTVPAPAETPPPAPAQPAAPAPAPAPAEAGSTLAQLQADLAESQAAYDKLDTKGKKSSDGQALAQLIQEVKNQIAGLAPQG